MHVARTLCSAAVLATLAALSPGVAHADPKYRACGTLKKGDRTLRFKAANLTCRRARLMLSAPTDDSARIKGYRAYSYTAGGCEGRVWTDRDRDYAQAHGGKLRTTAKTISYVVIRGCNS